MNDQKQNRFTSLLNECDLHTKRIHRAKENCSDFFPLTPESYSNLSEQQIEHTDQFVYRFSLLQDTLGSKVFPVIIQELTDNAFSLTFIDVLNHLEKAGVIKYSQEWLTLRETRNQLAHTYENDPVEGSSFLNFIYDSSELLLSYYQSTADFIRNNLLK